MKAVLRNMLAMLVRLLGSCPNEEGLYSSPEAGKTYPQDIVSMHCLP